MWHVTCDSWHVKCDMWWGVNILSTFQLPSSYGVGGMVFGRYFHKGVSECLSQWMIYKAVCRTAPVILGLFIISRPGQNRGCSTNTFFNNALTDSVIVCEIIPTALPRLNGWRWCFQSWNRLCYFFFFSIINLKGHPNCDTDSRVTAILLNRYILPIGGASAVDGLQSMHSGLGPQQIQ